MADIISFLKKNGQHFKRGSIEKAAGMQSGMIARVLNGDKSRYITPEQEEKIIAHFRKIQHYLNDFLKQ